MLFIGVWDLRVWDLGFRGSSLVVALPRCALAFLPLSSELLSRRRITNAIKASSVLGWNPDSTRGDLLIRFEVTPNENPTDDLGTTIICTADRPTALPSPNLDQQSQSVPNGAAERCPRHRHC